MPNGCHLGETATVWGTKARPSVLPKPRRLCCFSITADSFCDNHHGMRGFPSPESRFKARAVGSGSLAIFAAIRLASSRLSSLAAERRPGSSSK